MDPKHTVACATSGRTKIRRSLARFEGSLHPCLTHVSKPVDTSTSSMDDLHIVEPVRLCSVDTYSDTEALCVDNMDPRLCSVHTYSDTTALCVDNIDPGLCSVHTYSDTTALCVDIIDPGLCCVDMYSDTAALCVDIIDPRLCSVDT